MVILCTGVYLNARCIYGDVVNHAGLNGLSATTYLSDSIFIPNKKGKEIRNLSSYTAAYGNIIEKISVDKSIKDMEVFD